MSGSSSTHEHPELLHTALIPEPAAIPSLTGRESESMAEILIPEPHPEVRDLLVRIVQRLGHEAVVMRATLTAAVADVVLLEPADPDTLCGREAARETARGGDRLRQHLPAVPEARWPSSRSPTS